MRNRVIRADEGELLGAVRGCRDRFLVDSKDWGGGFALVEQVLAPRAIAAPVHRHTREDEFSFVLEGQVSFLAAGEEYVGDVGDLVFKPRMEWHTFWNATDEPARILEMISPGGLEEIFRMIGEATGDVDLDEMIERAGCEGDMAATEPLIERYGLTFG